MKAEDIIATAESLLLDPENHYWNEPELLGYINEAQRAIVNIKPDANAQVEEVPLTAGVRQTLPGMAMRLIDIPRNVDGPAITAVDRRELDRHMPDWPQQDAADTIEHYMYDDRYPNAFAVYPPAASGAKVELSYSATLSDLESTSNTLDLPDQYRSAVLDYVLFRAHSKDTEAAMPQRAQAHYQMFAQQLGIQSQASKAETAGEPDERNPRELR